MVSWANNKSRRAPTSSYEGGARALFYGFDMVRMLQGLLGELIFGNTEAAIPTYCRSDNPDASYKVDSSNTVTKEND